MDFPNKSELKLRLEAVPASKQLRLAPVRHHSPACAFHIEKIIRRDKPDAVLIEGPADAEELLPFLTRSDPPVALYAYVVDQKNKWGRNTLSGDVLRYRCFYPFAPFSPEWVALRTAADVGAAVQFIDLPYSGMLDAAGGRPADLVQHDASRLSDRLLTDADVTQKIVEKSGCRDFNEWWDRAFESGGMLLDSEPFFRNLLAFSLLLREPDMPADPETEAREACMAARIGRAQKQYHSILVITGGFHIEALARRIREKGAGNPAEMSPTGAAAKMEQGIYLVPYSLSRLDAANGYAAGIPHCGYYQRVWEKAAANAPHPCQEASRETAFAIGRRLNRRGHSVSFSESLEAVVMSRRLAALRGVPPGRPEILDAMASAFIKGARETEAGTWAQIESLLTPDLAGRLPDDAPTAPIVRDFHAACQKYKLPLHRDEIKKRNLDIYRSERHRQISAFFHQLSFLEIPYAGFKAGPDFAGGEDVSRVREVWEISWQPETEGLLIEQMRFGSTVADAACQKLLALLDDATDSETAASLWIQALMMGLHIMLKRILPLVAQRLMTEGDVVCLMRAVRKLATARSAGHVLNADYLPEMTDLLARGFTRICAKLAWTGHGDEARLMEIGEGLHDLDSFVIRGEKWTDAALFIEAVRPLADNDAPPLIRGSAVSILLSHKIWNAEKTEALLQGIMMQAYHDPEPLGHFLIGFLRSGRTLLLHHDELIRQMTDALVSWDEALFLKALPALRLAFTVLTPRETRAFSTHLRQIMTGREAAHHVSETWSQKDMKKMVHLKARVVKHLKAWGVDVQQNNS